MFVSPAEAEQMLDIAIQAVGASAGDRLADALETLPVPIYLTDRAGVITHYNRACIDFAGRVPVAGEDSWCVTWKIYTEAGAFLPHHRCPMAVAIQQKRKVRGVQAIAERPDGTRVTFLPYPTPLYDEAGDLTGAINLLVDVTSERQAEELQKQSDRCRHLAEGIEDQRTIESLELMAAQYASEALRLRRAGG